MATKTKPSSTMTVLMAAEKMNRNSEAFRMTYLIA
tara:strand:+ start:362 stop:466 length:105 start_codon:yes stop_codon:yes gene_type:complete